MLEKKEMMVSRRRIGRIMKELGLVSVYTQLKYKVHRAKTNEEHIDNEVKQQFSERNHLEVVVSDLTYVRVGSKWHYVCLIIDLFNREIIGHCAGKYKDSNLVFKAFSKINHPLQNIEIFHTDRGNEFKTT